MNNTSSSTNLENIVRRVDWLYNNRDTPGILNDHQSYMTVSADYLKAM